MSIKHIGEIPMGSPPVGALNTGGYKNFAIQATARYNGRPIKSRTWSIEGHHFQ